MGSKRGAREGPRRDLEGPSEVSERATEDPRCEVARHGGEGGRAEEQKQERDNRGASSGSNHLRLKCVMQAVCPARLFVARVSRALCGSRMRPPLGGRCG